MNCWKWATVILSILLVIALGVLGYILFAVMSVLDEFLGWWSGGP